MKKRLMVLQIACLLGLTAVGMSVAADAPETQATASAAGNDEEGRLRSVAVMPPTYEPWNWFGSSSSVFSSVPARGASGTVSRLAVIATRDGRDGGQTIKVAVDAETADGKFPAVLRIDATGQGDFTNAPTVPIRGQAITGDARIIIDGRRIPVRVTGALYESSVVQVNLGTAMQGECRFGDKTHRVRFVDIDGNLKCTDPLKVNIKDGKLVSRPSADMVLIDPILGGQPAQATAVGAPVKVDGAWWNLVLSADGRSVRAEPAVREMGKIRLQHATSSGVLIGERNVLAVKGAKDGIDVPADRYTFLKYNERYGRAQFSSRLRLPAEVFEVKPGEITEVACGSPLTAWIAVQQRRGEVLLDLKIADSLGGELNEIVDAAGQKPAPPTVKVTDASGTEIYSAKMSFG